MKFDGEFSIRDWKLVELYDILKAKADLQATQGTLDLHVKFKVRNNAVSGKVKPVLEDVKVESTSEDVGDRMKAWVADKALQLSSEDGEKRESGAEIPIQGRLDPDEEIGSGGPGGHAQLLRRRHQGGAQGTRRSRDQRSATRGTGTRR